MTQWAPTTIPSESDWLCETCGYVLNGLPPGGNCPECGTPTRRSACDLRTLPVWEQAELGNVTLQFVATSLAVIFRPRQFYRSLATRVDRHQSAGFALIHLGVASILLAVAGWIHADWYLGMGRTLRLGAYVPAYTIIPLALAVFGVLCTTTVLAARLTSIEASYRGLRLPFKVVMRGLDYHSADYLPVAVIALLTVAAYRLALGHSNLLVTWGTTYLYTLCVEVVLAAAYLFKAYWTAMRNMIYASR